MRQRAETQAVPVPPEQILVHPRALEWSMAVVAAAKLLVASGRGVPYKYGALAQIGDGGVATGGWCADVEFLPHDADDFPHPGYRDCELGGSVALYLLNGAASFRPAEEHYSLTAVLMAAVPPLRVFPLRDALIRRYYALYSGLAVTPHEAEVARTSLLALRQQQWITFIALQSGGDWSSTERRSWYGLGHAMRVVPTTLEVTDVSMARRSNQHLAVPLQAQRCALQWDANR